jgi:hypothetical protein
LSASKWDKLSPTWLDAGPPAAPSDGDLANYRRLVSPVATRGGPADALAVLGSTPSLRELASQLANEVYCIDVSLEMHQRASLMMRTNPPADQLCCADWLCFDLKPRRFSAFLGDKVLDNVPVRDWPRLASRLVAHLMEDGLFITRVAPQHPDLVGMPFTALLARASEAYAEGSCTLNRATASLWEEALGASARTDGRLGTQSIGRFSVQVQNLADDPALPENQRTILHNFIRMFWSTRENHWSSYSLGEVVDRLSGSLRLEQIAWSDDYAASLRQPLLAFRRTE